MNENILTEAVSKGKFSVLEVAKGRGYPQDIVDIYTDHETAFKVHRLEQQIASEMDPEKVNTLDADKKALVEKVRDSVLTFHMRGISDGLVEDLQKQAVEKFPDEGTERAVYTNHSYLANHIISVTNAGGDVDDHNWTPEEMAELKRDLPPESFEKLVALMYELTFAARYFDEVVSTDF